MANTNYPTLSKEIDKAHSAASSFMLEYVSPDLIYEILRALREPSDDMKKIFELECIDKWTNPDPSDAWRAGIDFLIGDKRLVDRIDV